MAKPTQWHTLVAGLWAATSCGFAYTFSNFSTALEHRFDLSVADLDTIGVATIVTGCVTFSTGMLVDRIGARPGVFLGGLLNAASWFVYWLIATERVRIPARARVLAFTSLGVFATLGAATVTGSVFGTIVKSFLPHEGQSTAVGVAKSWVGLASGLTATVFLGFCPTSDDDPRRLNYLLFLSGAVVVFSLVPLPCLHVPDERPGDGGADLSGTGDGLCVARHHRFHILIAITLLLICATIFSVLYARDAPRPAQLCLSTALLVLAALPWCLLLPRRGSVVQGEVEMPLEAPRPGRQAEARERGGASPAALSSSSWESSLPELVRRPSAWLLWFIVFAIQAGGAVLLTNLALITESRAGPKASAISASAVFSCAQSLGRLTAGPLSDAAMRRRLARPWCFVPVLALMTMGHGTLCLSGPVPLYLGVALAGYAFGAQYPVIILTVAELFGHARIASNYMFYDGMPGAFASLLFAKYLASWIFEAQGGPGGKKCVGDGCFRPLYGLVVLVQLLASGCACLLASQAAPVYKAAWASRAQSETRAEGGMHRGLVVD